MGVIPTPTNFKTLTFDGENSRSYGVYITGEGVFNAPERNVEMVEIPGRNGAFALDKGNFNNIEVTYPAGIYADTEADFAQAVSDFRNFLCSKVGYVRLEDDYNPNEYRLAIYKSGLEVDHDLLIAGEFDLVFECKPQRYLKSGETPITIGEWGETTTYTGEIAQFENPNGYLAVKSLTADIEPRQDLHGYDKPWVGGAGKNKLPNTATTKTKNGITFTVNSDGTITVNGTATAMAYLQFTFALSAGSYVYTSGITEWSYHTFDTFIQNGDTTIARGNNSDSPGNSFTLSADATLKYNVRIANGYTIPTGTIFKPMIRFASVSDATYEPWENICPITGWTGCEVDVIGFNQWGEETTIINSRLRSKTYIPVLPNTTYYFQCPSGTYADIGEYSEQNINSLIQYQYKGGSLTPSNNTFTTSANTHYIMFTMNKAYGTTYNNDICINLSDASLNGTYKPYNPNSAVYPVSWQTEAGTVYGGTVDVVSGVLTVNKVSTTISSFSNRAGTATTGKYRFYTSAYSDALAPASTSEVTTAICNEFNATSNANTYNNVTGFSLHHTEKRFYFYSDVLAELSVADANIWLSSNPIQVVYELATQTTYQLDPVQVACLLGQNNVWNNIADTSIEVGNDPNYVINPTRFEAQPILQANGKGGIFFGDVTAATITESYIGEIELSSSVSNSGVPSGSTVSVESVLTGTDALNEGDTITVSGVKWTVNVTVSKNITSAVATSVSNCTVTVSKSGKTATYQVTLDEVQFSKGTDATSTNASFGVDITYSNGGFVTTYVFKCQYRSGANKVTAICQYPDAGNWSCVIPAIRGDSTKSSLPNEIYIDLDIGEAYYYDANHDVVSLNNVVSIPADLPVIPVGSTPISYDNTITKLKVVPRWWKV